MDEKDLIPIVVIKEINRSRDAIRYKVRQEIEKLRADYGSFVNRVILPRLVYNFYKGDFVLLLFEVDEYRGHINIETGKLTINGKVPRKYKKVVETTISDYLDQLFHLKTVKNQKISKNGHK